MIQFDSGRILAHVLQKFDSVVGTARALGLAKRTVYRVLKGRPCKFYTAKKFIDLFGLSEGTDYFVVFPAPPNKKNAAHN